MTPRPSPLPFAALLTVSAAIRIFINDVAAYSRGDETIYLRYTQLLAGGTSYARVVRMFIDDPTMWVFPSPLRWSYLGATRLLCALGGDCSFRLLATLSTLAGIAAVALTYSIGSQLFDRTTALLAGALVATSPLQLALGRRALADEFFCALFLASIAAMLRAPRKPWLIAWLALTTLTFAAKEQFALIYPLVLLVWWLRERKIRWVWIMPPLLDYAVFSILARDAAAFFRVARITTSTIGAPYAMQYQNGPPQRLLIDFLAVAPLVTIAFLAAALRPHPPLRGTLSRSAGEGGSNTPKPCEGVLVLAAGILIIHSLIPSKNLRYVVSADPFIRLLVAAWLPRGRWWAAAIAANAAVEIALFYAIFISGGVYDPVTDALLRALRIVPL